VHSFFPIEGWFKPRFKKVCRFVGFFRFLRLLGFNVGLRTVARGRLHWTQEYDQEEGLYTKIMHCYVECYKIRAYFKHNLQLH